MDSSLIIWCQQSEVVLNSLTVEYSRARIPIMSCVTTGLLLDNATRFVVSRGRNPVLNVPGTRSERSDKKWPKKRQEEEKVSKRKPHDTSKAETCYVFFFTLMYTSS
jgi:hypothetical protein